jgi:glyceraldehyde 3-phosphate dehydrogenase
VPSCNIIPSSTGAKAVGKVIPELNGKLTGSFPCSYNRCFCSRFNGKVAKNFLRRNHGSIEKKASETTMKGVLGFTEDLVVSQDFVGDSRTSIVDANAELD